MRKAVFGLLFVMFCYSAISQEVGSLKGRVFDGQSGQPVEHAAIHLQPWRACWSTLSDTAHRVSAYGRTAAMRTAATRPMRDGA